MLFQVLLQKALLLLKSVNLLLLNQYLSGLVLKIHELRLQLTDLFDLIIQPKSELHLLTSQNLDQGVLHLDLFSESFVFRGQVICCVVT